MKRLMLRLFSWGKEEKGEGERNTDIKAEENSRISRALRAPLYIWGV